MFIYIVLVFISKIYQYISFMVIIWAWQMDNFYDASLQNHT